MRWMTRAGTAGAPGAEWSDPEADAKKEMRNRFFQVEQGIVGRWSRWWLGTAIAAQHVQTIAFRRSTP
ncbi:hypothetical protein J4H92_10505 [Leucobacter weissii]|uniref:Uncharacterized protein n=1 Tax=Leucobacter weissii TaxID=1983706 RepID=A0A939MPJ7_9MICO|nr:hypothetical protein [Leucobacter weissii]MBO1902377.1 hypothetical protein [Leucobacter weissii]